MTPAERSALVVKLQILGALVLPLVLIAIWLGSKGFFQALPASSSLVGSWGGRG